MARDKKAKQELVTREFTIHLHKRIHGIGFKRRAPRAISEIRKFATKHMGTTDVRIHADLNKFIWSRGIRNVPRRVRVRISRKRNEDEEAENKLYSLVTFVDVPTFKQLGTKVVDEEEEELEEAEE
ncbi:60S ribosomal protein L31 [Salpingoeca rosetta]|uniref:60S ribosomal protein L31 n=1 Tax=Salpingoeca rosetta (strain ATCC 50818 / BSB-021) TaxID=946362 RepID=F2UEC9_SALR5|nr:60S ribosomal protein L31 [Salpingoeca rosetta]EGD74979.1 60S ribosomal protein L31 [Salpingoeca rosetta]|eukprot:XP_004992624.1 60S ribosomal protein L31 [Salpingoeca rosetta]